MLQAALDFLDDLGVGLLHVGDALDHLDLLLAGQADQDFAGLRRQVGQDQRDGLRVLVLDERQQVLALGLLQEGKRALWMAWFTCSMIFLAFSSGRLLVSRALA